MSQTAQLLNKLPGYDTLRALPKVALIGLGAALIALIVALLLWSRGPSYQVLFSNLDDRDGGAIVSALGQMNVPYQFNSNGTAILVPQDRVHDVRMQMASQGLPRSGNAGFELLDQSRFGASQFTEQVTYQRALEGELANSIKAVHAVKEARVHLAMPRETLFVRDRQSPTASVVLSLYPGRDLSEGQVSAISWLISSSVPNLHADKVSIIDQNGRLLTAPTGEMGADNQQRNFVNDIEYRAVQRILTLLNPLVGAGNVRAQVTAEVDFSRREQTSEVYKPNQQPGQAAVRSQQTSSSLQRNPQQPQGVPGALSNQAPNNATANLVNPPAAPNQPQAPAAPATDPANAAAQTANAANATAAGTDPSLVSLAEQARLLQNTGNARNDSTVNYEVDRTISHVKGPLGQLSRLSVAVVVNYRNTDKEQQPLEQEELDKISDLVKQAVGYSADRGDSLSVVNGQFNEQGDIDTPFWKNPEYRELAMELIKYLVFAFILFMAWRIVINPIIQGLIQAKAVADARVERQKEESAREQAAEQRAAEMSRYEENLNTARTMAHDDPRAVAMVLRSWLNKDEKNENG
ncbi:flagellar basal-body MS-ring/collar protein FliF [Alcaligenes faecalis]|jgi:flagellar M-ring protein FliF|uniref:Flagellar M-ring protein n=1 Tax=Alcaligenes faecalis TaxID=511 RepID=A0A2U2BHX0_ALCFA|nr:MULTISPECIES: flagellar basal-body MS-ring/collar protein FliF [Alcaligenes]ALO40451.1 flagellar M-ring protein FliF [Alcaligenes faecalis]ATI01716.1 flagellar basal body M-ring protein FliF [Alcaligenes faecalis]AYZ93519.1 flagellar basal body M-ring protein FliF [Alcaligenes faecalis]KAA1284451.1 flagellar basal body M-ring protein FliF [Alcaligenes faecalis]KVX05402.1 flagellar M-ring protein FliF [Alcaligenes faecalis]